MHLFTSAFITTAWLILPHTLTPSHPHTLTEQDEGLEHLSRALRKQQEYGLAIQEEVDEHNGEGVSGCVMVHV